ncbi:hypothetical protein M422DRAFT_275577 [Sphaerobolus stellatus SS14]|uniref:Uncharacterized protein n=1 Tax=Sphaerobolus stellatus (strain SS14) TaxID=990650 RepID=A0A0C9U3S1_SPHS4|nr:hypothetical protein M422DRAFT_275577 [Sphaerobolus stellatus SS14]
MRTSSVASNRSSKSSRASSPGSSAGRSKKGVPMLTCESTSSVSLGQDERLMHTPWSSEDDDDESDDDDDEVNLSRILIPAKRQHSIRSLRTVLFQHQQRRSPIIARPQRRKSSLNPSRDRPRSPSPTNENTNSYAYAYAAYSPSSSPDATPRPHRYKRHDQSSLPARITREQPLHEEPASISSRRSGSTSTTGLDTDGGEEGHWDSGEFMHARVKRRRSGLPKGWSAWGK